MKTAVLALLAVVLAYGRPQVTSARPTAQEFVGTWRLVSIGTVRPNGEVVTDWMGPNPTGILIYDRTGHMSVQLMHGPRAIWPKRSADPVAVADTASVPEKVAAFSGYYAYYGRYEVSEKDHLIRHHIEAACGRLRSALPTNATSNSQVIE